MTVTYQLTENEFDYQLFKKIKAQFAHRNNTFKIKIEIEETEIDKAKDIWANDGYHQELLQRKANIEAGNGIHFTPEQLNEVIKEYTI